MFSAEHLALERLHATDTIRVPQPLASGSAFIVMEAFESSAPARDWQQSMGRLLAEMHRASSCTQFGFDCDNYIGTSEQVNQVANNWLEFWREQRLGRQRSALRTLVDQDDELLRALDRLHDRLDDVLAAPDEPAVLLHGDLWSGNAAADETGAPIIFDPASYYGHREAELGMMGMFGGFTQACFDAYDATWPLTDGADRRVQVYRLYHEVNHLLLFGNAYYSACMGTLRSVI